MMSEKQPAWKCRVAPGTAMTGNGDNDTPVQPQTSQWGRLCENHRWGETPVERSSKPPLDDFPLMSRDVEDKYRHFDDIGLGASKF